MYDLAMSGRVSTVADKSLKKVNMEKAIGSSFMAILEI